MARDDTSRWYLAKVRAFEGGADSMFLMPEQRRKGFITLGAQGRLNIYHSTAHRELLSENLNITNPLAAALGPRADRILIEAENGKVLRIDVDNEHPEVSWAVLWDKVWYESYDEPEYIWQSSASNNDFEPKYSLMPLAFGTLKAAFYAMLLGAPLAICGAIYTAYFMSQSLRGKIKPLIELMEALPTVILGFLAGLWLAPFLESNLTSVFTLLLFLPIGILISSFVYTRLPPSWRFAVPDGWEGALLIPVVMFIGWACVASNGHVEYLFFDGDMRAWVTNDLGISFDQRNALVVGIAMGFAVIPTIFSITEDAIFSVPKHLSNGSLALGATRWQTLVGVVLPTASPGIFSALMIGLGRAVGETMIVLMATGNTPIMDLNIFEGMRTLAANIAVEVPEAEVDSSHYRVLFLAALVLFSFTFMVNTVAEIVRQRLRQKYGQI
jgi:phosphate transport system permease protein